VKLDYLYVLNWSIWLDFVIILKTFKAILGGRGAY
jgi:lipopolysaccharide/colanic/teichoic acid biosynthesis glycosyltransferase